MTIQKNVGGVDRGVRIALGIAIMAIGAYYGSLWGALGLVLLATGVFQFCGLYTLLGISTRKSDEGPDQQPQ
jgi:hypothetical protein